MLLAHKLHKPAAVRHLVVVDADLPDLPQLLAHLPHDASVVYMHPHAYPLVHPLEQLAQAASECSELQGLHIFGHGLPGRMLLGRQWVSADSIARYPEAMTTIASALADDAHIWLYGCHSAEGEAGEQWLDAWALATGAGVRGTDQTWGVHTLLTIGTGGQHNPLANHLRASGWRHVLPWLKQTPVSQSFPGKAIGEYRNKSAFAALKSDGSVVTWGNSSHGGDSSGVSSQLSSGVTQVFSAAQAFAALKSDGTLVTWGRSGSGGNGPSPFGLSLDEPPVFSTPYAFAAIKKISGDVVTWGQSESGGYSAETIGLYLVTQVFSNDSAFAALRSNGSVVTWGELGGGGDSSSVSSQLSSGVVQVFSTRIAFAALKSDGSVVTWGISAHGGNSSGVSSQLSSGVTQVFSTYAAFAALKSDGSVVTWGDSSYGGNSNGVNGLSSGVTQVFSTGYAFAALKSDGSVVTWGDSSYGGDSSGVSSQLSSGVTQVFSSFGAFAALKNDGSVVTWGHSSYGGDSSGISGLSSGVTQVFSTGYAFAALKSDGSVVTWGDSSYGGNSNGVNGLSSGVTQVFSTDGAFAALKGDGSVVTWGSSSYGGDSNGVSYQLSSGVVGINSILTDDVWGGNGAPTISGLPGGVQSVTVGTPAELADFTVAEPDGVGFALNVTLTTTNGTLGNLTDADAGTAGIQLTGTAVIINTAIAGATFTAAAGGAASIGISVTDGVVSTPTTGTYSLTAVAPNVAPTIQGLPTTTLSVVAGTAAALTNFAVSDANGDNLTVTLTPTNGTLGNVTDADSGTTGIQLTGTVNSINASLYAATFTASAAGAASLDISVSDGVASAATGTYNLNAEAAPDTNTAPTFFSGVGKAIVPVGSDADQGRSVIQQSDGKLVVAGSSYNGSDYDFSLIRFNADGSLDTGFGTGGKLLMPVGSSTDEGRSVIQQADGKLVVAGSSYNGSDIDFSLIRLNANGSLDTDFGTEGKLIMPVGSGYDYGQSVTPQSDGKLVVTGYSFNGSTYDFSLIRLNADGSLDSTFGTDGKVFMPAGSGTDEGRSVIQQSDGKMVVAGSSYNGGEDVSLIRLNADGSLDTTFGTGGKLLLSVGSSEDYGSSVIQQSDGKLVVAGYSFSVSSGYDFSLIRLNADGSLDTGFGSGGKLLMPVGSGNDEGRSVIQQSDGKLVMAGHSFNAGDIDFSLIRLNVDGSVDAGFGTGGKLFIPVGSGYDYGQSVIQQTDGKLVVAGFSFSDINSDFSLIRVNADGSLDSSFTGFANFTLDGTSSYTANAAAVALDNSVSIYDAQLAALNSGKGDYSGARVTIARHGGANAEDVISVVAGSDYTLSGADLQSGGQTFAIIISSGGVLSISFTGSEATPTQALVNDVLSHITYANSSDAPPATVTLDWNFSDGNSGSQGSGGALIGFSTTTVSITAANEAPTIQGLPNTTLGVVVGTAAVLADFAVADANGDNLIVTLTTTNGTLGNVTDADAGTAGIQLTGTAATINTAIAGATFTAAASGAAIIGIEVTDGVVSSPTTGTYNLTAIAPPTDIAITATSVNQSAGTNATVGTLSTINADTASGYTYSLVSGTGDTNNTLFNISGSTLRANDAAALAAGNYSVRIRTTDPGGLSYEEAVSVTVVDDVAPTLTAVSIASNNANSAQAKVGDVVTVSFTTDGSHSGTPTATMLGHAATVTNTSGNNFTATYTLVSGDAQGAVSFSIAASDAAGNAITSVTATTNSSSVNFDKTAPIFAPSTSTPADDATAVGIGNDTVLRFGERLAASSDLSKVYLKDVTTDTLVPASINLNADGHIVINPSGSLSYNTAYYVTWDANALKDAAGNAVDAVTGETTFNFTSESAPPAPAPTPSPAPAPAPAPTPAPTPAPPPVVVDGASVTTTSTTTTTSTGQTVNQTTQTVAPVDTPPAGGDGLADIPLVSDASGNPLLEVSLPTGVGLQVTSISGTGLTLDTQVNTAVLSMVSGGSTPGTPPSAETQALAEAVSQSLQDTFGTTPPADLVVRSMSVTVQGTTAPTQPIQISGSTNGNEALIIDVSSLPSGTVLDLSNVRFAVIVGNTTLSGGEGRNVVVADGGRQFMVLGADDDELHAGGGDDVVGSKGGDDKLWGDEGNDKVVGGIGNDELYGGDGNDIIQGGPSDAGQWSVKLDTKGQLNITFTPGNTDLADSTGLNLVGNWTTPSGQGLITDARLSFVHQDYTLVQDVALLIHGLAGRLPTLSELGMFATAGFTSAQLAEAANSFFLKTLGFQSTSIDTQVKLVVNKVLGLPVGTTNEALLAQGKDTLANGGTWGDVWLNIVRSDAHKAKLPGAASAGTTGTISLVQTTTLSETGWSVNAGDNKLYGDAGNDVLIGGSGSNLLDGGTGTDLAVFFGALGDFEIARAGSTTPNADVLLRHKVTGAINTLHDVEYLKVGDTVYAVPAVGSLPSGGTYVDLTTQVQAGGVTLQGVAFHVDWM